MSVCLHRRRFYAKGGEKKQILELFNLEPVPDELRDHILAL